MGLFNWKPRTDGPFTLIAEFKDGEQEEITTYLGDCDAEKTTKDWLSDKRIAAMIIEKGDGSQQRFTHKQGNVRIR